jgi:outer membrane lipoprotein
MRFKLNRNLLWMILILSGCAPVLSQTAIDASDRNVLFGDLQRNTENYIGQSVLFGGTIIRVGNDPQGGWAEILQRPLGFRMEPEMDDQTGGRFLLLTSEILDEQIFSKGRKITLAGKVEGKESRSLDKISYDYPLLRVQEYHLWPISRNRAASGPDVHFSIGIFGSF